MPRRKGKSKYRIRDVSKLYEEGRDVEDLAAGKSGMGRRGVKLREDRFALSDEEIDGLPCAEGMVTGLFRGGASVRVDRRELLCGIAKTFRAPEGFSPLAVGDDVTVALATPLEEIATEGNKDRADGMILSRQDRRSALIRPRPVGGRVTDPYRDDPVKQVIAANMDVLLIVASTREPKVRHTTIDRFLIVAEHGEMKPVVVVNKIDLHKPEERLVAQLHELSISTVCCSAVTGDGVEELREILAGKRSVLAGPSGVGKSTLINALIPEANAATRSVRAKDERGRHTTSSAVVYDLPDEGLIVDTPGVRELGIDLQVRDLPWYFPDIAEHALNCRFNDCTHTIEPQCAVKEAVEMGRLPQRRYDSYLRILESLQEQ
ncbi:MAG: ribosome small subunit-dependent GTPase A [Phycisphaerae bacterium]